MNNSRLVIDTALDVYNCLTRKGISCAIGGALALAFHVDDPRATRDIDVNITLPSEEARTALAALPPHIPWNERDVEAIERDDQVRLMLPVQDAAPLPVDLFFAASPFHALVAARTVDVPFGDQHIKILSATDLTIFKALFNRAKDWIDIEAMLTAHDTAVDLDEAVRWLIEIVGADDARHLHLQSLGHGRNNRAVTD